jgi:hypothetical protein
MTRYVHDYEPALKYGALIKQSEIEGGVGGISFETPTGSVNGSNTSFIVQNVPTYIVADNQTYFQNFGFTLSGTGPYTVTMDAAPYNFIQSAY